METPLELSFKNMDPSDFVRGLVTEKMEKLERRYGGITSAHVFIDAPHRHHRKGNHYEIRLEVRVPGTELVVNEKPGDVNAHEDIKVAVRDAFNAMERQLVKWKERISGEEKTHEAPLQGRIVELHPERDFGQIDATDGRLIYFHRNSLVEGSFDELKVGDTVELLAVRNRESELGPQASAVRPIGRMRFVAS